MRNKVIALLLATTLLCSTPVLSAGIVVQDPPQMAQGTLGAIQSKLALVQTQLNAATAYQRKIAMGYAGRRKFLDLDQINNIFQNKFKSIADENINKVIDSDFKKLLGADADELFSIDDFSDVDLNQLKNWGVNQATNLTNEQIREIFGDKLASKLTVSQIQSLINNPSNTVNMILGLFDSQQQAKTGLEAIGITGDKLKDKTKTIGVGPNSNRSDAFGEDGNGSSDQYGESLKGFKSALEQVVKLLQVPADPEALMALTRDQIAQISYMQTYTVRELGARGLAKAWIQQTKTTRKMPTQEAEAVALINGARYKVGDDAAMSWRKAIQAVTTITIMTAETLNNDGNMAAADLATIASQSIPRTGYGSRLPIIGLDMATVGSSDTTSDTTDTTGK